MVTVFLNETGQEIDVLNARITYVKQVGDIGDITKVSTSYSWGLEYPKTPRNVAVFKGLGLTGDASNTPYIKIRVNLLDDGISIVSNGLLIITQTDTKYKGHIQDGIVDFFKEVSVDKISDVIDLSPLTHLNTIQNIIASFTNDTYRYVISNFNGPPLADVNGVTNLNPFALVPSINIGYLFDTIMQYYGWTYTGDIDLAAKWMTYPNATGFVNDETIPPVMVGSLDLKRYGGPNAVFVEGPVFLYEFSEAAINTDFMYLVDTGHDNPTSFAFSQPGNYRVTFAVEGFSIVPPIIASDVRVYLHRNGLPIRTPVEVYTTLNGSEDNEDTPDIDEGTTGQEIIVFDIVAFQNEVLQLATYLSFQDNSSQSVHIQAGSMRIDQLGVQSVDFSAALIKLKVKDFFKEVLTRQAATPFVDIDHRNIHFINIDNRLSAPVIDWSAKYARRKAERYVYDSYARNNNLTHKYDTGEEDFNDGVLVVDNENLPEDKDLFKSFTHSPLEEFITYRGLSNTEYLVNNFKMFTVEVKTDPDTQETLAEYKPIKNRFYIFDSETREDTIYILGNPVSSFPIATIGGNTFKDIVAERYQGIRKILNDTRIHTIELVLTKWEVAALDLSVRYYFAQEAAVYMLNKLTWKNAALCEGEFVRLLELVSEEEQDGNEDEADPDPLPDPDPIPDPDTNAFSMSLQGDSGGSTGSDGETACGFALDTSRYHDGNGQNPTLGDKVYTTSTGGTVFNGNDKYYRIPEGRSIKIAINGQVTDVYVCGSGNT